MQTRKPYYFLASYVTLSKLIGSYIFGLFFICKMGVFIVYIPHKVVIRVKCISIHKIFNICELTASAVHLLLLVSLTPITRADAVEINQYQPGEILWPGSQRVKEQAVGNEQYIWIPPPQQLCLKCC